MRLPETGKRKYGFDVLKGQNQLYHVHALALLEGAVRGLGERLFHCSEASCSRLQFSKQPTLLSQQASMNRRQVRQD